MLLQFIFLYMLISFKGLCIIYVLELCNTLKQLRLILKHSVYTLKSNTNNCISVSIVWKKKHCT